MSQTLKQQLLTHRTQYKSILPDSLQRGPVLIADFKDSFWQQCRQEARAKINTWPKIKEFLAQQHCVIAVGPYGEIRRHCYPHPLLRSKTDYIHLGTDLIVAPKTPVFAPLSGWVKEIKTLPHQDYGTVVILKHELKQSIFFTLYGHLSTVAEDIKLDSSIPAGKCIGWVGDESNNGGWPPHVHFQILDGKDSSQFAGAILMFKAKEQLAFCLDPNIILQMEIPLLKTLYLPDLCSDLDTARIKRWYVKEGSEVKMGDPLLEFESMKVNLAIAAPFQGKVLHCLAQVEDTIDNETPLLSIATTE